MYAAGADASQVAAGGTKNRFSAADLWGCAFLIAGMLLWGLAFAVGLPATLFFFLLLGLAAATLGLFDPSLGLYGVTTICLLDAPMRAVLLKGGILRFNTLNYWLLVVALLYLPALLQVRVKQSVIMQLIIMLFAIGLFRSDDVSLGCNQILGYLGWFGYFVYFARTVKNPRAWLWMAVICGVFGAIGSGVCWMKMPKVAAVEITQHPTAWFYFPLTAIFACTLVFPFARKHGRWQLTLVFLVGLNMAWLLLTARRSPLIIGGGCLLYMLCYTRGAWQRITVIGSIVALFATMSIVFPVRMQHTAHRFYQMVDSTVSGRQRTSGRWDLYVGGWHMFLHHPVGCGTGGFKAAWAELPLHEDMSGFRTGQRFWSHSGWVNALVENGVPGLAILVIFVMSFPLSGYAQHQPGMLAFGATVMFAMVMGSATGDFETKAHMFLTAGATVMLHPDVRSLRLGELPAEYDRDSIRPATITGARDEVAE